ncbi:MAG: ABC transporter ATP-binding protein [Clostridiales bacterium]|nr:ABC transporter ATP-binding protein [Clostridiales bacterium]
MEKIDLKKHKLTTNNLRKILPIYKENKTRLFWLCVCFVITGVLGIFAPIYSANALANLADAKFDAAIKCAVILAIISLIRTVFNGLTEHVYVKINSKVQYTLTDRVIRSINKTKMSKLDGLKLGAVTERLGTDVNTVSSTYLQIIDMLFDIVTNAAFFIYIGILNFWIFLILLVYVAVLYGLCIYKSRVWIRGRKVMKEVNDKARSSYYEQITGIRDVKLLNIKENITSHSNSLNEKAIEFGLKFNAQRNILRRVQAAITAIFASLFIILGVIFVNKGLLLLTGFLVIYSYYGRVEWLVQYFSTMKENKAEGEISATRIFEVIEDYEKEVFGDDQLENFSGNIELKDVEFSYTDGKKVLNKINMSFESGKMTAIVGKSGSGKTTILSVISKLYDINGGAVLLDGVDIKTLNEQSIRSNVGVISQSPYIFNTTIRQNLLFVKPDATEKELIDVLKKAQIYDDIKKLEFGIDSEIGENGVKLSGGQKQRVAIARLLLMDSKVIIFDEATSALDNSSQKKIVEMLDQFKDNKTIIIVAHRLSTIVGADKIYVIEDGKNIAEGTHKKLMRSCKKYKELYELEEESADVSSFNEEE